jgi:hypothetical protein
VNEKYHRHPMGRSFAPVAEAETIERFDTPARNPFESGTFTYFVERKGGRVFHHESVLGRGGPVAEHAAEVRFAVGSGQRGRAYLVEADGFLFASPITWYPQEGRWDLAPDYAKRNPHFARPVTPDCLFCHTNRIDPEEGTVNRYRAPLSGHNAIGCERCHGPGALHVGSREGGAAGEGVDYTIVNPRRLEHPLREAVCQQCHLQGEQRVLRQGKGYSDYRPGMPLHAVWTDLQRHEDYRPPNKFVGTVEQMRASRCYQAGSGEGRLGCVSCHDPHDKPSAEGRVAYFRAKCLACHAGRGCAESPAARLRRSPEDSCVDCHMPRTGSTFAHASVTDHRIPRRPAAGSLGEARAWSPGGAPPLVAFFTEADGADRGETARALGVALVEVSDNEPPDRARALAEWALPLLDAALAAAPDDPDVSTARGQALWLLGRLGEARKAFDSVLRREPRRELTLFRAAALAGRMKRPGEARALWERAVALNPFRYVYHAELASLSQQLGEWPRAARECERALALQPSHRPTRQVLVLSLVRQGDRGRAARELETLVAVSPPEQRDGLRQWYARLTAPEKRPGP